MRKFDKTTKSTTNANETQNSQKASRTNSFKVTRTNSHEFKSKHNIIYALFATDKNSY